MVSYIDKIKYYCDQNGLEFGIDVAFRPDGSLITTEHKYAIDAISDRVVEAAKIKKQRKKDLDEMTGTAPDSRLSDDLCELLIAKGVILETELPLQAHQRLILKRSYRTEIQQAETILADNQVTESDIDTIEADADLNKSTGLLAMIKGWFGR